MKFQDLTGRRFSRLVVIDLLPRANWYVYPSTGKAVPRYRVRCDCGCEMVTDSHHLCSGNTRSCGCLQIERAREVKTIHGCRGAMTKEYSSWSHAKHRTTPGRDKRRDYADRGIQMCRGWRSDFESFLNDMGNAPSGNHSIDRINNNGHYSCGHCEHCLSNGWPMNCRWATCEQQARNRTGNVYLTKDGIRTVVADWAKRLNIHPQTISGRLHRGLSDEDALYPGDMRGVNRRKTNSPPPQILRSPQSNAPAHHTPPECSQLLNGTPVSDLRFVQGLLTLTPSDAQVRKG